MKTKIKDVTTKTWLRAMADVEMRKELTKVVENAMKLKRKEKKMTFRPYQERMIDAQDAFMADPKAMRGSVFAATGAGKTECFIDLIRKVIDAKGAPKILIVHPRLALSTDQQERFAIKFAGMNVEFTSFSSDNQSVHTLRDRKNKATTVRDELIEILENSDSAHITFSSYKSVHKIADLDYDVIICDEAHYLVQSDLRNNLHEFKGKTLFYTGTPIKAAAQEESMDNINLFGKAIAEVPPSELIPNGYIVAPKLRTMEIKNRRKGDTRDYAKIIGEAYKDQAALSHDEFNHKMLVAMPQTGQFDNIMQNLSEIREITGELNLDVYSVTAGIPTKNGAVMSSRKNLLKDFAENENPAIIIHCDTLAEGIDVDGLGGVLVMRGLGMVKAIQTIGRAVRALKADMNDKGEIKDMNNRIKSECIVTLVTIDNEPVGDISWGDWVEMFREAGYDDIWDLYEPNPTDSSNGEVAEQDDPIFDIMESLRIKDYHDYMRRRQDAALASI